MPPAEPSSSSGPLNFASIAREAKPPQQKVQQQQPQTVVAVGGGGGGGMIRLGGVLPRARGVVHPDSDSEPEPEGKPKQREGTMGCLLH